MASSSSQSSKYLCGHCSIILSKTQFYKHKKLYFNKSTRKWQSIPINHADYEDFMFDDSHSDPTEMDFDLSNDYSSYECDVDHEDSSEFCNITPDPSHSRERDYDFSVNDDIDNISRTEVLLNNGEDEDDADIPPSEATPFTSLVIGYIKFIFFWQFAFHVSDVGVTGLLSFFIGFLLVLGRVLKLPLLLEFAKQLPKTAAIARKILGQSKDQFKKYICCPECSELYEMNQLDLKTGTNSKCVAVKFPDHPQTWRRKPCGTELLKRVRTSAGTTSFKPRQVYSYKSIIDSMTDLLSRPEFLRKCEEWRNRERHTNIMDDIYDGRVWQQFMVVDEVPFLSVPYNFAFSLNVDWFQPFKHTRHSVGVLYVAIQNLPRKDRFLTENIIIVGVIPGPHEPSKHINTFLKPFVAELQKLWEGLLVQTSSGENLLIRAALICVACDIPAARKVCGFVGHSAQLGCSKCLKHFPYAKDLDRVDYSGFDPSQWTPRNNVSHRESAKKHRNAKTLDDQAKVEKSYGCRYSVLLELPYFDPVVMCVIDPMHNLLLGTAKHMLSVWKDTELIKNNHFNVIQSAVDSFTTPSDVGRIPTKISSGFSSFTAEQWKNWTLLYSLYSLKGILPHRHFKCWQLFVKAASLLCQRAISEADISTAHSHLLDFLNLFEVLYGKKYCSINLHLHAHLCDCLKDFGPVYSFWLFSFERMNGILGGFKTNSHDIAVQLMRRFLNSKDCSIHHWPADFKQEFSSISEGCVYEEGSLSHYSLSVVLQNQSLPSYADMIKPVVPVYEDAFECHQNSEICSVIRNHLSFQAFDLLTLHEKCGSLRIGKYILGSTSGRFTTSSVVKVEHSLLQEDGSKTICVRLAEIHYFLKCSLVLKCNEVSSTRILWLAAVSFYDEHQCFVWFGFPTQVWGGVSNSSIEYIPITSVISRVAFCKTDFDFGRVIGIDNVIITSPVD